ncbi:MAG: HlyD family efflux transporter periplasmic adaptor subunit, partial [Oscillibacter sp.]|nr:HlyD family efflux transporter periplasmic adaptor subunit [Oscillibacter sp.]
CMTLLKKKETETVSDTAAPPKKRKKFKKKWLVIALIAVLAAALVLPRIARRGGSAAAGEAAYTTAELTKRTITKSLSGSGTLQPANAYSVTTLIEGEILSADFEEGDIVAEDSILYQVDSSDAATNIEKAQISYNQSLRSYEKTMDQRYVRAGTAGEVVELTVQLGDEVKQGQSVGTVRDASVMTLRVPFPADDAATFTVGQSATVTIDSTFETLSGTVTAVSGSDIVGVGNMVTRNVTIQVENPGGLTNSVAATAAVNGLGSAGSAAFTYRAESTLTASASGTVIAVNAGEGSQVAEDQVVLTLGGDDLEDTLQSAEDSMRNAELSMANTQETLDNYTITSPISGTVIDKQYKAGDTVTSGRTLCTIYDLSYLEMTLNIDELDISSVAVGQSVRITADAVEGKSYTGVVTKVSVVGTTSGGTTSYPATIRIDETDGLLPGMNVDAEIVIEEAADTLAIPAGAVSRGSMVLITADSPSAVNALDQEAPEGYVYVQVETGISDDDYAQVLSGLQEGDTVAYIAAVSSSGDMAMMMPGMMGGGMTAMPSGGMPSGGGNMGGNRGGGPGGGF